MNPNTLAKYLGSAALVVSFVSFADTAPYSYTQYQSVLDDSYLQAPTSTKLIKQGDFAGQYNQYFHVPDFGNQWMTFSVTGDHKRSELRQVYEWYSDDGDLNKMIGEVFIDSPLSGSVDEITFMQVHDVTNNGNAINKPLLRLVWLRERNNIENGIWAVIKKDADVSSRSYDKIYITQHLESQPIKFEVRIQNNEMTIKKDGAAINGLSKYDISYWSNLESYFKAGVYNQDDGTGTVQFKSLKYYTQ
ncbi:alginate lyase precursor [Vibrio variabilis]|uniref:Alginate lyase n=1 Tax=Vibrio variabilis TaxID=990271 RepID=A0ABQ0J907_9VIBR|nr:alginate lyase precursor [Vibrio variabilis]